MAALASPGPKQTVDRGPARWNAVGGTSTGLPVTTWLLTYVRSSTKKSGWGTNDMSLPAARPMGESKVS